MFRFLRDIVVDCVPYRAGDVVPADKIPAGSVPCLLSARHAEKYTPPPAPAPEPAAVEPVTDTPKPAAKKGAKAPAVPSE